MANQYDVARALLSIQAVFLQPNKPFTWASGIKSPIYCDNRLTLSHTETRTLVDEAIAEMVKLLYPTAEMLMGTATAGIAHAAIAADRLALPMGYVRGSAKDHGRHNQIEGRMDPGTQVVIIEDLISTGGSVIECAEVLREAGAEVLGVVSIFSYGMPIAAERLGAADLACDSLCTLDSLVEVAVEDGYITALDRERLIAFRNNPKDESWMEATGESL
ncbi:MAG: orotate phosphoribosyltransferase [Atopobiaceae bacterium]|nr:orotate phosphoribosyltransferase [Atopobiaceae bacterium]